MTLWTKLKAFNQWRRQYTHYHWKSINEWSMSVWWFWTCMAFWACVVFGGIGFVVHYAESRIPPIRQVAEVEGCKVYLIHPLPARDALIVKCPDGRIQISQELQ